MKYVVIVDEFLEKADGGRVYKRGEMYPAVGYRPPKSRIKYLLSNTKGFGQPVIEAVEEDPKVQEVEVDEGA